MENSDELKDWLVGVLEGIVSNPNAIEVEKSSDEMGVLYTVRVSPEDVGVVIGKLGNMAKAIRTILSVAGMKIDVKASMKIDAPGRNFTPPRE